MHALTKLLASASLAVATVGVPANAATVVDFSGQGTGGQIGDTYANLGLTFSTAAFFQCDRGCPAPTPNGFFAYNSNNAFTAFFASAQTKITFQTVSMSSTLAQAYDVMNNLVASTSDNQNFPVTNQLNVLSGTGITRVVFSYNGGQNGPAITNLSFNATAVPEASTWAMMLAGFSMMGASMRYRRKSAAVSFA